MLSHASLLLHRFLEMLHRILIFCQFYQDPLQGSEPALDIFASPVPLRLTLTHGCNPWHTHQCFVFEGFGMVFGRARKVLDRFRADIHHKKNMLCVFSCSQPIIPSKRVFGTISATCASANGLPDHSQIWEKSLIPIHTNVASNHGGEYDTTGIPCASTHKYGWWACPDIPEPDTCARKNCHAIQNQGSPLAFWSI